MMIVFRPCISSRPKAAQLLLAASASACLVGCGPPAPAPAKADPATTSASSGEAGFVSPPRVVAASQAGPARVQVSGIASPNALVRLATPQGQAFSALADDKGGWTMRLPAAQEPVLFGLSFKADGRTVQAEGYLAVLPGATPAIVQLRAGAGAMRIGAEPAGIRIEAIDVDVAGAAVVSGASSPGSAVTAAVDAGAAGEGAAGEGGRFAIALTQPLSTGDHEVSVRSAAVAAQTRIAIDAPVRPQSGPYRTARLERAWRIDWITPGGGLQTTVLFDAPGAAS